MATAVRHGLPLRVKVSSHFVDGFMFCGTLPSCLPYEANVHVLTLLQVLGHVRQNVGGAHSAQK